MEKAREHAKVILTPISPKVSSTEPEQVEAVGFVSHYPKSRGSTISGQWH
jgi:hypothetical protein